jgi:hypothetical protein
VESDYQSLKARFTERAMDVMKRLDAAEALAGPPRPGPARMP